MTRITLLVDNKVRHGLREEHGLSMLIEAGGGRILLDTGAGDALESNAEELGIDLSQLDAIVLSHGHYDHTGGLSMALEKAPTSTPVFLHPKATKTRFSIRDGIPKANSMPRHSQAAIESLPKERIRWTEKAAEILPGVWLTGEIRRKTSFEDVGGPFFLDEKGAAPDMVEDDMALWIDTPEGAVICLGCCHAGLVNTLRHIGKTKIRAIIGGMHLQSASRSRMDKTISALCVFPPARIIPCHCTGGEAAKTFAEAFPGKVEEGFASMTLEFQYGERQ